MKKKIIIESKSIPLNEIKTFIQSINAIEVELELKKLDNNRGISPEVLVAIIAASSSTLGVLISEITKYYFAKKKEKIIIETSRGRIEVPSNISQEMLEKLTDHLREVKQPKIIIP